jgi:hypothetical protein
MPSPTSSAKSSRQAAPTKPALLRILIAELRVNSRDEILLTYRVGAPVVCAQTSSVEPTGIEPVTSCLQRRRSSAATGVESAPFPGS